VAKDIVIASSALVLAAMLPYQPLIPMTAAERFVSLARWRMRFLLVLFTLPLITSYHIMVSSFPIVLTLTGQYLMKNLIFLGAALVLLVGSDRLDDRVVSGPSA